ncbi:MATE family efflux transporter [Paenibacillus thalictri]|uniref:Probable multidrug resistance protein NorM n=1 Tax=Paenibacillus thalictri TaxID=2527873 RepID=A0A4Q9DXU6_9BACL|nr:MATE family efflux transporter [Paenibacillus thalictri]TBL80900.1 MATE family efflux transporter [Paenibacillus thalictri]
MKARLHAFLETHFSGESIDYRQVLSLFLPVLIDQAFMACLNMMNTAMISSSGVAAVSAVNMIDSVNMFLIGVFVAISTGGTVVVAQYKGSGNAPMVSKAAASTVSSVSLLAICIALVVILGFSPVLNALFGTAEADVFEHARLYLIGSGMSYLAIAIIESVNGSLRGIGRTRVSMTLSLIMNLSYVLLNIVFIKVLDMGVLGMVIAANIARYLGAACAIYYLMRLDTSLRIQIKEMIHIKLSMLKKILYIGLPLAAEQMFFNGGKILTQVFIVGLGTHAIATNAISSSLAVVFQIPSMALSICTVTVVGQCIGRRNIRDARKFTRSFLWLSSASFVLMALIMVPLFQPIVGLFHPPADIVHNIYVIILINSVVQVVFWPISFLLPSALRAAGDSKFTSITAMLSMWLFRVVFGYIFGIVLGFGVIGVWVAMQSEWGVRGAIFLWRFRGEKWYKHRLIEPAAGE